MQQNTGGMMTLSRLVGWSVLALTLVGGGLIMPGYAAEVDIVACFDGAVPSTPQTCPAGSDRINVVSIKSELTHTLADDGGGGGGSGKVQFAHFAMVKRLDSTSPKLFLAVATGRHTRMLGIGVFTTVGMGQTARLVFSITLTDVVITRIADIAQDTLSTTEPASMETIEFAFSKIELLD